MPNTLAHLGVQAIATRSVARTSDHRWIYWGCLLPDIPWMLQRMVRQLAPWVDPYDLRLYVVVQASLALTMLLVLAMALCQLQGRRVGFVLGFNVLLHYLLDAMQVKWASGVHLLAPVRWQSLRIGLWPPEGLAIIGLTLFGFGYVIWHWARTQRPACGPAVQLSARRKWLALSLVAAYGLLPLALMADAQKHNVHFVDTLRHLSQRKGKPIEIDRGRFVKSEDGGLLETFAGENIVLTGHLPDTGDCLSLIGRFTAPRSIHVQKYFVHRPGYRDGATIIALLLLSGGWLHAAIQRRNVRERSHDGSF